MKRAGLAALAVAAAALPACTSQWYPGFAKHDIARTDVVIRTEPSSATVLFDGAKLTAFSPVRQPVEYDHEETSYERQSNYGERMREDMGMVGAILTFPVWLPASLFHYREDRRRHVYGHNRHVVVVQLPGYEDAEQAVTLEGEAERPVTIKLLKSKK